MNDISDLFDQVARSTERDPSADVVEADVERGHHALSQARRRRTRRVVAGASAIAVLSAGVFVASQVGDSDATKPVAQSTTTTKQQPPAEPSQAIAVKLIAYSGKQLEGFTVDRVPEGWRLSGSTQYALTINAPNGTDENPDVFLGKLTVLLQSQDASGLPSGTKVSVAGQPGVITDSDEQMLTYNDGRGHTIVIQAPAKLAWSNAEIVSFAEGVHVTGNAVAGRG